jgi:glycosyltransferase involved in cell wall biosynthesis
LPTAIKSIVGQTYKDWSLLVVVQGRSPALLDSVADAAATSNRVRVVAMSERGLSRARNVALQSADGEVIAMLDDDCEAAPDWLATIASCFGEDQEVGLVGGALRAPARRGFLTRCPAMVPRDALYDPSRDAAPPIGWDWIGANFAIQRWAVEKVGGFDEHLGAGSEFMAGEDTDYKLRLEQRGVKMRSTPEAVVNHTWGSRRGLRAVLRFQRSYAVGNGALAGKLTLAGDPRGEVWLARTRQQCMRPFVDPRQLHRGPESLLRWSHYRSAYKECLSQYDLEAGGMLRRRLKPESTALLDRRAHGRWI